MQSRFIKLGVMIAAIASLAVGGSAIATAAQKGGTPAPVLSTTTPAAPVETSSASDGDTIQEGDQSTPDVAGAADAADAPESAASESASESSAASDGPGGHADPAGNVDNQQEGQN